jgi:hypothetical protein
MTYICGIKLINPINMRKPRLHKQWGRTKRMDENVYSERRQVMDIVYEAKRMLRKNGIELPRINVRIAEQTNCDPDKKSVLGVAQLSQLNIYIMERTLKGPYLRSVVLHEIVHAVTGFEHDEDCLLMHPHVQPQATKEQIDKAFLSYFK